MLQVVGEYSYDLDGEVELEDVMEKLTSLLNWDFKGTISNQLMYSDYNQSYLSCGRCYDRIDYIAVLTITQ